MSWLNFEVVPISARNETHRHDVVFLGSRRLSMKASGLPIAATISDTEPSHCLSRGSRLSCRRPTEAPTPAANQCGTDPRLATYSPAIC